MIKKLLITLGMALLLSGCSLFRTPLKSTGRVDALSSSPMIAVQQAALDFERLEFTAEITFTAKGAENTFSANFRVRKDSLIWVSIRKLGFEGARVLLSRDSVWVLDRISAQYFAGDYRFFRQQFNLEFDYNMAEALLLGNPFSNWSDEPVVLDDSDDKAWKVRFPERYRINQGMDQRTMPEGSTVVDEQLTISRDNGKILYHSAEIPGKERKLSAVYGSFIEVGKYLVPSATNIIVKNEGAETRMDMQSASFRLDEVTNYPFKIPGSYSPMILGRE